MNPNLNLNLNLVRIPSNNVQIQIPIQKSFGDNCDLEIYGEGFSFHVHRVILCEVSQVWKVLLSPTIVKSCNYRIHFNNDDGEALGAIFDYIYKGVLAMNESATIPVLLWMKCNELMKKYSLCCEPMKIK